MKIHLGLAKNLEIAKFVSAKNSSVNANVAILAGSNDELSSLIQQLPEAIRGQIKMSDSKVETIFKNRDLTVHKILFASDARSQAEQGAELVGLLRSYTGDTVIYFLFNEIERAFTIVEGFFRGWYKFKLSWDEVVATFDRLKVFACPSWNLSRSELNDLNEKVDSLKKVITWVTKCRWLIDLPSNVCDPGFFAEQAAKIAKDAGLKCSILDKSRLKKGGFGGISAVAGDQPAFLIDVILDHNVEKQTAKKSTNKKSSKICLMGKGLTFDTGGICIKPPEGMGAMKSDMSGAAIVVCSLALLSDLGFKGKVRALAGVTCNGISESAMRPGDIIRIKNGQLVQVDNTDAEGRLVLADLISHAVETGETNLMTVATLTGGVRIGLGLYHAGVFSTNPSIFDKLERLGEEIGEKCWRLPLEVKYEEELKVTDEIITNIGNSRSGHPILAAMFLKKFVPLDVSFTHLDVAGVCYHSKTLVKHWGSGATGFGVKLLSEFIRRF